jgi:serine-type D-Ala-D-Ala carboxypeptidase/endopeptidase (penicillin-binding protein 4)
MKVCRGVFALFVIAASPAAAQFAQKIPALIEGSPVARSAYWGVEIVDLATGKPLYSRNASHLFVPASNAKLFTAALALERLGADFRFHTRVLADAAPDAAGIIHGSVRLAGGGDPNLSARAVPYRAGPVTGNPLVHLEDLADQVAARGVKRIEGDTIGDDTWYVWEPFPEGWAVDDLHYEYGAPVSALTVNDNAFTLLVEPAEHVGDLANVSLRPPVEFYQIENLVRTVGAKGERKIRLDRQPGSRQLRLWGTLPSGSSAETLVLAVDDPAEYAARAFREALEERGIVVEGGVAVRHRFADENGSESADDSFELATHESAPLIDDLGITAKVSQNLHAELALRAVARAHDGSGSRKKGLEELKAFLVGIGIGADAYSFADGSGLDRADLVTPAAIVKLLRHMYDSPERDRWIGLLPIAGQDGTLSGRFAELAGAERIHAKTGSLSHVAALSGYAQRKNGSWVAFSILVNNYNGPAAEVRSVIDRICTLIVE